MGKDCQDGTAGERLDLASELTPITRPETVSAARRFVGIHFACCDVYTRVYVNQEETAYDGRCARCGRRVAIRIGPGGTDSRFFTAY